MALNSFYRTASALAILVFFALALWALRHAGWHRDASLYLAVSVLASVLSVSLMAYLIHHDLRLTTPSTSRLLPPSPHCHG